MIRKRHNRSWVVRFAVWLAWRVVRLYAKVALFSIAYLVIALLGLALVAIGARIMGTGLPDVLFYGDLGLSSVVAIVGIPWFLRWRKEGRAVASYDPRLAVGVLLGACLALVLSWLVVPTLGPELPTDLVGFSAGILAGLALLVLLFLAQPQGNVRDRRTPASPVS